MSTYENIALGIVTGILTTVLLLLAKSIFYKIIVPWYLKTTYKGVDVSGKWEYEAEFFSLVLELKQAAHNLSGVLIITTHVEDKTKTSSHFIIGDVWEGYLSLKSDTVDKRYLSYGNFLLKVESGRLLKGVYLSRRFRKDESVGILAEDVSFTRDL